MFVVGGADGISYHPTSSVPKISSDGVCRCPASIFHSFAEIVSLLGLRARVEQTISDIWNRDNRRRLWFSPSPWRTLMYSSPTTTLLKPFFKPFLLILSLCTLITRTDRGENRVGSSSGRRFRKSMGAPKVPFIGQLCWSGEDSTI